MTTARMKATYNRYRWSSTFFDHFQITDLQCHLGHTISTPQKMRKKTPKKMVFSLAMLCQILYDTLQIYRYL